MTTETAGTGNAGSTHLDERARLPKDVCVLLESHPRDTWRSSPSPLAQFWIDKHNYLRHQSTALMSASDDYREQRVTAAQFGAVIAPRLQRFLAELHGHHQIEDHHYFPSFRAADPRLGAGFDVLARDHELLHEGILKIVDTVNAFISTVHEDMAGNEDAQRHAADRYIAAAELMHARLARHLEDEEDLIIPLMLARGA